MPEDTKWTNLIAERLPGNADLHGFSLSVRFTWQAHPPAQAIENAKP